MDRQQIAISGLGGQGVLFVTRVLAQAAVGRGMDVLSSETHGMAMRGGAVMSHLKVGDFSSPLIRSGQADVAVYLAEENLTVHPGFIGEETRVLVSAADGGKYPGLDAGRVAEEVVGRRQSANLVLLGYGLGLGYFFADAEEIKGALRMMSRTDEIYAANEKALEAGLSRA